MQGEMDEYTVKYIKHALFDEGEFELIPSETFNDQGLSWEDKSTLNQKRVHWKNEGWYWDGDADATGVLWGGCIESVDEMLRHATPIPSLEQFKDIVLMLESSEELPTDAYVKRVLRALGERGILGNVKAVLVGRAKSWEFDKQNTVEEKAIYRENQKQAILEMVRKYNQTITVIQNVNFGHTDPQIPMPYGGQVRIENKQKRIFVTF
jgi:muramoyltetrapeptide carboxypeptidase LdcA involved in peptidoglycan recycling